MKKSVIVITTLVVLFVGFLLVFSLVDFNRLGKQEVFIEVIEPSEVIEEKLDNGAIAKSYQYDQTAYDKDGEAMEVEFFAVKELRKGAYLKLYVKGSGDVSSYDEVQFSDIPQAAQEQLDNTEE